MSFFIYKYGYLEECLSLSKPFLPAEIIIIIINSTNPFKRSALSVNNLHLLMFMQIIEQYKWRSLTKETAITEKTNWNLLSERHDGFSVQQRF